MAKRSGADGSRRWPRSILFSDDETFGYRAMSIGGHDEGAVDFVAWEFSLGAGGILETTRRQRNGDAAEQHGRRPLVATGRRFRGTINAVRGTGDRG